MFEIFIVPSASAELRRVPVYEKRRIEASVDKILKHSPSRKSKSVKCLRSLVTGFEHEDPLWQLRVDEWRVFYDVDMDSNRVTIRAVRCKPHGLQTEEIV